jgi:hypothetical protein
MSRELTTARLFLYAVLPLFEELPKGDEKARKAIKGLSGVITFVAPKGLSAQVEIRNETVSVTPGRKKKSSITLFLPTVGMLNNLFRNKGFALPLPIWGIWNLKLVNAFTKMGDRLNYYMDPKPKKPFSAGERQLAASLLLLVATIGGGVVGQSEPETFAPKIPDGIAHLNIKGGASAYVEKRGMTFTGKKGTPKDYNLLMSFRNADIAYAMFTGTLDFMAAIPVGDIELSGSVPMADQFSQLMLKVGEYTQ